MSRDASKPSLLAAMQDYLAKAGQGSWAGQEHLYGSGSVAQLEAKLARFYDKRYAVCVSNATIGLLAVALALDLRAADFVTTPYTYGATVATWLMLGSRAVFADIDPETLTVNPASARSAITGGTRAVLAADVYGHPADSFRLRRLANEFGLWYVADAAQSFGAMRDGKPASAQADVIVTSFTVGKTLFAGEGGAVLCDNPNVYARLLWFSQHPARQKKELGLHLVNEFGLNGRIHPLATIWANATFDESLARLRSWQQHCFRLIKVLNSTGLTELIHFEKRRIAPSFFRLTAAWRYRPKIRDLESTLRKAGSAFRVATAPVNLIYRQPAFLAQYQGRFAVPKPCREAERQARLRFSLVPGHEKFR